MKNPEILVKHLMGLNSDLQLLVETHKKDLEGYTPEQLDASLMALRMEALLIQIEDRLTLAKELMNKRIKEG